MTDPFDYNPYTSSVSGTWAESMDRYITYKNEMTMRRPDYQKIAQALANSREKLAVVQVYSRAEVIDLVVEEIATALAADNPAFKREVFVAATKPTQEKG